MCIWIAALLLLPVLSAQTLTIVRDPPSETSFRLSPVEFSYPGTYRSFRQVDFRNLPLHVFDEIGEKEVLPLKNGKYELLIDQPLGSGFEVASFESVRGLSTAQPSRDQFSLALYSYTYGGGSSNSNGIAQVFALSGGRLKIVQQMSWDTHFSPPGNWNARFVDGMLTVRSARYLDGDTHCCISGMDIVTLKWNGLRFVQTRMVTERLKP